jgi:demethylmenaquinone methyltransferase/2-methoxy-6-polyprenyl-1,4-benzoquinol methylase
MTHLTGNQRAQYVQGMFTRIASSYDLMNRLMTFGQDAAWRREVIKHTGLPQKGAKLLDLGAGTGDLGFEALRKAPDTFSIEADFTIEMLRVGQQRVASQSPSQPITQSSISWSAADALNLPFSTNTFDAVVSGFLMRNVIDLPLALYEQYRVLKPGGRIVILDTTHPRKNLLTPFVRFHMHFIIPLLGRLISGQHDAYEYLPDSSEAFLSAEAFAGKLSDAGFRKIAFRRLNFGTIAIHWGIK